MKLLPLIVFIILVHPAVAQYNSLVHFSVWEPKAGLENQFDSGYRQHLQWHVSNKDPWSWYGWYVISGQRVGHFIDATFDHSWADFDNPVNPAGDAADNALHTEPYGNFRLSYKLGLRGEISLFDSNSLRSKYLRHITLQSRNIDRAYTILGSLRHAFRRQQLGNLLVYEMVDGGELKQWTVLIGADSFEALGKANVLVRAVIQWNKEEQPRVFESMTSETWRYRPDMSLFPQ